MFSLLHIKIKEIKKQIPQLYQQNWSASQATLTPNRHEIMLFCWNLVGGIIPCSDWLTTDPCVTVWDDIKHGPSGVILLIDGVFCRCIYFMQKRMAQWAEVDDDIICHVSKRHPEDVDRTHASERTTKELEHWKEDTFRWQLWIFAGTYRMPSTVNAQNPSGVNVNASARNRRERGTCELKLWRPGDRSLDDAALVVLGHSERILRQLLTDVPLQLLILLNTAKHKYIFKNQLKSLKSSQLCVLQGERNGLGSISWTFVSGFASSAFMVVIQPKILVVSYTRSTWRTITGISSRKTSHTICMIFRSFLNFCFASALEERQSIQEGKHKPQTHRSMNH